MEQRGCHGAARRAAAACSLAAVTLASTLLMGCYQAIAARAAAKPHAVSNPSISGDPQVGQTLTEVPARWSNSPTSITYKWFRCDSSGNNCSGLADTDATHTVSAADVSHTIIVQETATNDTGSDKAKSAPTAVVTYPSTTSLLASPTNPVTNQTVTLIATVTSSSGAPPPSGAITFANYGGPLPGCGGEPVHASGASATVVCVTRFAASVDQLTAIFSPLAGSTLGYSTSPVMSLTVGRDYPTTSLDVSRTVGVGASTTFTTTVAPPGIRPGPVEPTGSVEFFDGGEPIGSCRNQAVINDEATCTVTYRSLGQHSISALYGGDWNFTGSFAPAQLVVVSRLPANALGLLTSTMQWTFSFTPTYTTPLALEVNGASGASVLATCHGRGCPFTRRTAVVRNTFACGARKRRSCPTHGSIALTPWFAQRRLRVGSRIAIAITRPGWVGKYYLFTVRAGRAPRVQIKCLAPGRTTPGGSC